jgi:hypothetical protein
MIQATMKASGLHYHRGTTKELDIRHVSISHKGQSRPITPTNIDFPIRELTPKILSTKRKKERKSA